MAEKGSLSTVCVRLVAAGLVPDGLVRAALQLNLALTRARRERLDIEARDAGRRALLARFAAGPIALHTDDANQQHYEVPTAFFQLALGRWLKYSCCYWPEGVETLDAAEEAMLRLTCERAQLADGMRVLDLGCGWGSLALWIAQHYPRCQVLAVSNSSTQKAYIDEQVRSRGLTNLETLTANAAELRLERRFERVLSIEMFEHMKNYGLLLRHIADLLDPGGRLFVHIFCHHDWAYEFDPASGDWMARNYFSGGTMPSQDLLLHYQEDLRLADRWVVGGSHYVRTLRAWLGRLDTQRPAALRILAEAYGPAEARKRLAYWRLFFLICEGIFRYRRGSEYFVGHYLFEKPGGAASSGGEQRASS